MPYLFPAPTILLLSVLPFLDLSLRSACPLIATNRCSKQARQLLSFSLRCGGHADDGNEFVEKEGVLRAFFCRSRYDPTRKERISCN